jgi:hypothetical protein
VDKKALLPADHAPDGIKYVFDPKLGVGLLSEVMANRISYLRPVYERFRGKSVGKS